MKGWKVSRGYLNLSKFISAKVDIFEYSLLRDPNSDS